MWRWHQDRTAYINKYPRRERSASSAISALTAINICATSSYAYNPRACYTYLLGVFCDASCLKSLLAA